MRVTQCNRILWDVIILTVRDELQKHFFELQLSKIYLNEFCSQYYLLADEPEGTKIGMYYAMYKRCEFFLHVHLGNPAEVGSHLISRGL